MKFFLIIIIIGIILSSCSKNYKNMENENKSIRLSAVAGKFYPENEKDLSEKIDGYLKKIKTTNYPRARALMVPHAGYDFSGEVAAYAYKAVLNKKVNTVFLLGNSHTSFFEGLAIDENDFWQTPLGKIEVDKKAAQKLIDENNFINFDSSVHIKDHVIEVQLPFLQKVLEPGFKIVPILFGNYHGEGYEELVKALVSNIEDDDLLIISSDMSHYPTRKDAKEIDLDTLELIKSEDIKELDKHTLSVMSMDILNLDTLLCSPDAVKTVMGLSQVLNWDVEILKYSNGGDEDGVVGYGAVIFKLEDREVMNSLNEEQKKTLLKIARDSVETYVRESETLEFEINDGRLNKEEGVFVTIHKEGKLRGCIGQVFPPRKPLWENVRDMAISACSHDNRFLPIQVDELELIDYEISVISKPHEIDDWKKIELGKQGVIISKGYLKGVFLPQVAEETGWELEEFLSHLCTDKAGLSKECYKDDQDIKIEIFTTQVF